MYVNQVDGYEVAAAVLTLLASVLVALWSRKKNVNAVNNFARGVKNMSVIAIVMSHSAASLSGILMATVPATTYAYGLQRIYYTFIFPLLGFAEAYIFWPVLFKFQFVSIFEYFELRFNSSVRLTISIICTLWELLISTLVVHSACIVMLQVTGLDMTICSAIFFGTCIVYTILGGFRGLIIVDNFQFAVMIFCTILICIITYLDAGGLENVGQHLSANDFRVNFNLDLTDSISILGLICRGFFTVSQHFIGSASYQRSISLTTLEEAQRAGIWHSFSYATAELIFMIIGAVLYVIFNGCDPVMGNVIDGYDELMTHYLSTYGKKRLKGIVGVFLSGVICATLSSIATYMNNSAIVLYRDIILKLSKRPMSDRAAGIWIKSLCAAFGVVGFIVSYTLREASSTYELLSTYSGLSSGAYLAILTLAIFFPMVTSKGILCATVPWICIIIWMSVARALNLTIRYPTKVMSVDKCPFNITTPLRNTSIPMNEELIQSLNPIYRINSNFHGFIGFTFIVIVALVMSYLTGPNKVQDVDKSLLSPLIHKYIPTDNKRKTALETPLVPILNKDLTDIPYSNEETPNRTADINTYSFL